MLIALFQLMLREANPHTIALPSESNYAPCGADTLNPRRDKTCPAHPFSFGFLS